MKKKMFKVLFVVLLLFNVISCEKIKNFKSKLLDKQSPDVVIKKYYDDLMNYDDSNTSSKNNKIDDIVNNYIDVDKLHENSVRTAAEYSKLAGKQVSDADVEKTIAQYRTLGKDFKETATKLGFQSASKAYKSKLSGRDYEVLIGDKDIKYTNADKTQADVRYVVKTGDEILTDEHAILEKIDNKWKIVSFVLPEDVKKKIQLEYQLSQPQDQIGEQKEETNNKK